VHEARLYTLRSASGSKLVLATFPLVAAADDPVELFPDPSAAADARARRSEARATVEGARRAVLARARTALAARERLAEALARDLAGTEGAERWRELAESLLAQVTTAREVPGGLEIDDLYAEGAPKVVVPADRGEAPQVVAERLFARHRKARRTRETVATRGAETDAVRTRLADLVARAERAEDVGDLDEVATELDAALGVRRLAPARSTRSSTASAVAGARRFVSSDGFEILVGRSSAANDTLTFKVAKPSDLWFHAADYPGSHVVIRNPGRGEVPHRTLVEAAQLAAYHSDAQGQALADVRYTPRRFVTKPRGAPPGLVRLARFKTIAVRPSADVDRAG
jgi:predicted ribosome quality control (RQC) complex YloA/Tae2 family protein